MALVILEIDASTVLFPVAEASRFQTAAAANFEWELLRIRWLVPMFI